MAGAGAAGAAGAASSNEPAGYVRFAEISWNALPADGAWTSELDGLLAGQVGRWNTGSRYAIEVHGDAPSSPPNVLRIRYPSTLAQGSGPGTWNLAADPKSTQFREVYARFHVKIDGPDFENHPVGTKLFGYFGSGRVGHVANQNYWLLPGGSGDTGFGAKLMTSSVIRFNQQDIVSRAEGQNLDPSALFTAGEWHLVEYVAVLSGVDVPDGELHMWIDGVKIHEHTDVLYRTSSWNGGFFGVHHWAAIWGGNKPGTQRTRDDDILIDHFYMSGIEL
jgi:hypothetical protein